MNRLSIVLNRMLAALLVVGFGLCAGCGSMKKKAATAAAVGGTTAVVKHKVDKKVPDLPSKDDKKPDVDLKKR